jgi:S-methylmethionine-dependent homocysteine/selenocysteine methylase
MRQAAPLRLLLADKAMVSEMFYERVANKLKIKSGVVLLDGALGTELRRFGVRDADHPYIWSVSGLLRSPETVFQIHQEFALAGADVITAGAFRTNRRAMGKVGLEHLSRPLTILAVSIALSVQEKLMGDLGTAPAVAGNITAVEDCYFPERSPGRLADKEHEEQARILAEAGCDFILIESMPALEEAISAIQAARRTGKPVWLSMVLAPILEAPQTLDRTSVVDLPSKLIASDALPDVLLFNCCQPVVIEAAIEALQGRVPVPSGAYANVEQPVEGGGPWERIPQITPERYAELALRWVKRGAKVVGGCCGTTPEDIRAIRRALKSQSDQFFPPGSPLTRHSSRRVKLRG